MADKPEVQLYNVRDYHHGADQWFGLTAINITKNLARLQVFRHEGELIGSVINRVADDNLVPVQFTLRAKTQEVLFTLLDLASGTVTFKATNRAGAHYTVTMTGVLYGSAGGGIEVSRPGEFSVQGVAATCTIAAD